MNILESDYAEIMDEKDTIQLDAATGETPSQSLSHTSFLPDIKSKLPMKHHEPITELKMKTEGITCNCFMRQISLFLNYS